MRERDASSYKKRNAVLAHQQFVMRQVLMGTLWQYRSEVATLRIQVGMQCIHSAYSCSAVCKKYFDGGMSLRSELLLHFGRRVHRYDNVEEL